jgi:lipoprotein-anchoring transpeptidase ErfK/SrfK
MGCGLEIAARRGNMPGSGVRVEAGVVMRRRFLLRGAAALAAEATLLRASRAEERYDPAWGLLPLPGGSGGGFDEDCEFRQVSLPAEAEIDYPISGVAPGVVAERYRRQEVSYAGAEPPGTIVVDPKRRFLFHIQQGGKAMRYGVGVGRAGFGWSGRAEIGQKRRWPRWVPTCEMVARDETAAAWLHGMPGGPGNPLGARALYLYTGGKDTLYRIHGTNEPRSIGRAVSSGCIRMLNEDVAELYEAVPIGTPVVVLGGKAAEG